jgi:hypothetical protein
LLDRVQARIAHARPLLAAGDEAVLLRDAAVI